MPKEWKLKAKAERKAETSPLEVEMFTAEMSRETPQLDLHGMRPDEADTRIDWFLDRSFAAGEKAVRIIHGKGMGILRQNLHEQLKKHPLVAAFRDSQQQMGGATIVALHARKAK